MGEALDSSLNEALERSRQKGEAVAEAVIVEGEGAGARLLVWRGGQALGDLGSPRLNQRVALYAEGLLERGGSERKRFDVPAGELEIETTVFAGEPEGKGGAS